MIRESYDGGNITVGGPGDIAHPKAADRIRVSAYERGCERATLLLTRDEADQLIDALIERNQEIDAAALSARTAHLSDTSDSRPSASPVAEGRAQTAPDGAGAAPTDDASGSPLDGGHTRTTTAGPSTPTAEPGRPISHHDGPDGTWCAWSGCVSKTGACPDGHELPGYVEPSAAVPSSGRFGFPATSTLSGLSIAEITAARLAAYPDAATVPFEAGGALHVVDRCGCSDCEDAFARQFARSVAAAEANARAELLANSTLVVPGLRERGDR
jgi:hypothetical protein